MNNMIGEFTEHTYGTWNRQKAWKTPILIKDAEGYAIDRINRAQGDATKFLAVYKAYALAKDVTKKRLYLECV